MLGFPAFLLSYFPASPILAWLHDLDPYAIQFPAWSPLPGIRWYGLSYLLGFFLGYLLVKRVATVGVSTLRPEHVGDYIVSVAIGIVLGGRLGYCLLYEPSLFIQFFESPPWWGALALNRGGMASHGGIVGGVLGAAWYARRHRHDLPFLLDLFAFGAPLGLFFGRLANFVNGELFGREAPADAWYAVKFPQELIDPDDPTLLRRVSEALRSAHLLPPEAADLTLPLREVRPMVLSTDGINWLIARIQNGDEAIAKVVEPLLTPRHPSQLYAAVGEGLVVFAVLLFVWRKPRVPGVVGSWFMLSYGVMRISDEFFRRPDQHIADQEFATLGITRGQWLSVLVLCVAAWGFWYAQRRAKKWGIPAMGSWRRGP